MNAYRKLMLAALTAAVLAVLTPNARAQMLEERIQVAFSGPVELPGQVLPAGSYIFEALENGRLTRILSVDGQRIYATLITVPEERTEPVEKATVILGENTKGVPEKVEAWFYPGESVGSEFMYRDTGSAKGLASSMGAFSRETGRAAEDAAKGVADSAEFLGVHAERIVVNSGVAIAHGLKYLVS